jgi:uncharacterized membrane protein YecN with MAPEG domain
MIVLPITLTIAAAAALINLWIAGRVVALRQRHKVVIGDGGNEALTGRMRAQANFIEYAAPFLILLALVELAEGPKLWLWIVAIVFVLARIIHVFGMDRPKPNVPRAIGFMVSFLALLVLAIYALVIAYGHKTINPAVTYVAADQAPASTLSPTKGFVRRS